MDYVLVPMLTWSQIYLFTLANDFDVPFNKTSNLLCFMEKDDLGLWWTNPIRGSGTCERRDYNKELCGMCCELPNDYYLTPTCSHIWLRGRYAFFQPYDGVTDQICGLINNCERNYWYFSPEHPIGLPDCSKRGVCKNRLTHHDCECQIPWFGRNCEHKGNIGEEDLHVRGVDIFYNSRVRVSEIITIIVAIKHPGKLLSVVITANIGKSLLKGEDKRTLTEAMVVDHTSIELIKFCEQHTDLTDLCSRFLAQYSHIYSTNFRFPLVRDENMMYHYFQEGEGNYPIGYRTNVKVSLFNNIKENNEIIRTEEHLLFVEYPIDISCYKNVEVVNCPEGGVIRISPRNELQLTGSLPDYRIPEVKSDLTCLSQEQPMRWKIWQLMSDGSLTAKTDTGEGATFIIKPFVLDAGVYKVEFSYSMLTVYDTRENFAVCTLVVREEPIIAIIKRGPKITVNVEGVTTLDGSDSYDPNLNQDLNKQGLTFEWKCTSALLDDSCIKLKYYLSKRQSVIKIPPLKLKLGEQYFITLKVSKKGKQPGHDQQAITVGTGPLLDIGIECIEGCYYDYIKAILWADPKDYIYLKAKIDVMEKANQSVDSFKYDWFYSECNTTYTSANSIRVKETRSSLLKIDKNKLEENKVYCFQVKVQGSDMKAELDLSTNENVELYNCTVEPTEGITGLTLFNFKCVTLVTTTTGIVVYEVFDKSEIEAEENDSVYSGRMIETKEIGEEIKNFRLVKGNVVAYVFNEQKMIQEFKFKVKLFPFNGTIRQVKSISNFKKSFRQEKRSNILNTASVVPVILLPGMNRSRYLRYLVSSVRRVELDMLRDAEGSNIVVGDIKLCLSTIQFILQIISSNLDVATSKLQCNNDEDKSKEINFTLEAGAHKKCADILLTLSTELRARVKNIDKEQTLTQTILLQMLNATLNVVEILLAVKNPTVSSKPIYLVNQNLLNLVKETSYVLADVFYQTSNILLWQQKHGDVSSNVASNKCKITGWVKVDQPLELKKVLENDTDIELKFSDSFVNLTKKFTHILGVHRNVLYTNPFWWSPQIINTYLIFIQLCKKNFEDKKEFYLMRHSQHFIHLYYDIKEVVNSSNVIEGRATWLESNSTSSLKDLDLGFTVYRFDPPERARMFIRFIILNEDEELKVLFKKNLRPTYSMMMNESSIISQHSPEYQNLSYEKTDEDKFYYMGVLPHKNSKKKHSVKFKIKIYYTQCKTWLQFSWGTWGCWVGDETNDNTLQCDCNHFSLFGGSVQVPPYVLHSATNYFLFLTTDVNWLPISILIVLFFIYLIVCILCRIKDKKDSTKAIVIFLEDNYPGERYAYLVAVFTGSRLNSGTNSNVGIKIVGDQGESRPHILKSNDRKVLNSDSDDWFLLYSRIYLGTVESIQIWHDNSGKSPDWFVERILVFDLVEKFEYIFEMNIWVAFEVDEYPEAVIATSNLEEFFSVKKLFASNFVTGLRDTHYWTSVLWKHPRNPVSRIERVTVLMCFILVAMSFSLMFYIFYEGVNVKEDEPSYFISNTEIIIFSLTLFVSLLPSHLAMFLFRKSFTHKHERKQSSLFLRQEDSVNKRISSLRNTSSGNLSLIEHLQSLRGTSFMQLSKKDLKGRFIRFGLRAKLPREKSTIEKISFALHSVVRGSSLEPVRLPYYQPSLKTNRVLFVAAWIVCVTIIVITSLVVIIFGFRLPIVKSYQWATVFILVIVFDALVLSTLYILLSSLLLSFMFQTIVPTTNYQLKRSDEVRKHLVGDLEHLFQLLKIRAHPMYCPMSVKLKTYYKGKSIESMKWRILVDFLVLMVFTVVLSELNILSTEDLSLSNSHAEYMLNHDHNENHLDFKNLLNRTHYENFLINSFIYQLFKAMWYNEDPFYIDQREEYWCDDSVLRLLGSVRIRQLRVQQVACSKIKGYEIVTDCSPPWSPNIEDTDVFEIGWTSGDLYDVQRKSKAWSYTKAENSNSSSAYGVTLNFYHSGGYIADIGYKWSPVFEMLALLKSSEWLGHMTRAVFVEITLYNVNTKLFTEVISSAEQMPSGQYLTVTKAESVTTKFKLDLWFILYLIFVIYVFVKLCIFMNRNGSFVYLSKVKNVFEVILLILGLSSFALYFFHIQTSSYYVSEFQRRGTFEFFSFLNVNYYVFTMKLVLYTLFICVFVKFLFSWRFGRIYYTFYYTVFLSLSWILWTFACFIIFLVMFWRLIGYTINAFIFNYFTIITKFYHEVEDQSSVIQAMTYMMCLITFFVFLLFVASFSYYYKVAKVYKLIKTDTFNFVIFLINKIRAKCKR